MKLMKFLKKYGILLAFLGAAIYTNIWSLLQHISADEPPKTADIQITQTMETTTPTESQESQVQTTAPPPVTTAPPSFQQVSASYFDDALFIGDSRTEGLALYGDLTNADYFCSVGMTVYDVQEKAAGNPNRSESCTLAQKLTQQTYGKVYIMLGLNELGTGTAEKWAAAYADVIAQVRQAQPNAIIYLQSILYVSAAKDDPSGAINNQNVQVRNNALQQLEKPSDRIYYLNVNEAVADENGCLNATLTSDGIHLLGNALPHWEQYLQQHAILPAGTSNIPTVPAVSTTQTITEATYPNA